MAELRASRAGFSLIEALVVLVISGMALLLIFSVGLRATETGFRLGRGALSLADRSIQADAYRRIVEGFALVPMTGIPSVLRLAPVSGDKDSLTGDAILSVNTTCAPAGPAAAISLEILPIEEGGSALMCTAGEGDSVELVRSRRPLALAYSEDGIAWTESWTNDRGPFRSVPEMKNAGREQRLYVRLSSDDGSIEVTALARSGRPEAIYVRDGSLYQ